MAVVHLDFETRSACEIKKSGADVYARHATTDILCTAFAIDDGPVTVLPMGEEDYELLELVYGNATVVAHNAPFELAIWNHVGVKKYGWPELRPEQMLCTMAMAYSMGLPGSLANAAAAVGITNQKDLGGQRVMMQLSQPRDFREDGSPVWWEDLEKTKKLHAYCAQDVEVERELFKRLMPLSQKEREVWLLDYQVNQRGVQVDMAAVNEARRIIQYEKIRLDAEMRRVTKNAVATCTATGQLTDWLKSRGVACEGVAKSDVTELLQIETTPEDCRQALRLRQEAAKSSTAKLEAMLNGVCEDGRMRGLFQYHGAGTGRWAGRRVQLQNLPRGSLEPWEVDGVFEVLGG